MIFVLTKSTATLLTTQLLLHAFTFFSLYAPAIRVGGGLFELSRVVNGILTLVGIAVLSTVRIKRRVITLFVPVFSFGVYVMVVSVLGMTFDWRQIKGVILTLYAIFAATALGYLYIRRYGVNAGQEFVRSVFVSGVIHSIIMILVYFYQPFRNWLYSFVYLNEVGEHFIQTMQRSPGLTKAGGDGLSVLQAIAGSCGVYLFLAESGKNRRGFAHIWISLTTFLVLLSILLSARTGLMLFLTNLLLLVVLTAKPLRSLGKLVLPMVTTIIGSFGVVYALIHTDYSVFLDRALLVFEVGLLDLDSIGSVRILKTMFFLPDHPISLLFGTGNFGRDPSLAYIPSDVGYVRVLFGSGIVGVLLLLSFYGVLGLAAGHGMRGARTKKAGVMLMIVVLDMLALNVKALTLFGFVSVMVPLFVIVVYQGDKKKPAIQSSLRNNSLDGVL